MKFGTPPGVVISFGILERSDYGGIKLITRDGVDRRFKRIGSSREAEQPIKYLGIINKNKGIDGDVLGGVSDKAAFHFVVNNLIWKRSERW